MLARLYASNHGCSLRRPAASMHCHRRWRGGCTPQFPRRPPPGAPRCAAQPPRWTRRPPPPPQGSPGGSRGRAAAGQPALRRRLCAHTRCVRTPAVKVAVHLQGSASPPLCFMQLSCERLPVGAVHTPDRPSMTPPEHSGRPARIVTIRCQAWSLALFSAPFACSPDIDSCKPPPALTQGVGPGLAMELCDAAGREHAGPARRAARGRLGGAARAVAPLADRAAHRRLPAVQLRLRPRLRAGRACRWRPRACTRLSTRPCAPARRDPPLAAAAAAAAAAGAALEMPPGAGWRALWPPAEGPVML